jgi:signal transduction histidine kinase
VDAVDTLEQFLDRIDPRDRQGVAAALSHKSVQDAAMEFRTRSGLWRRLSGYNSVGYSKDGLINGVILDIDPSKKVEKERLDLLRRLSDTQENERRRISRELHDQIGQVVTGLLLGLKSVEQSLTANGMARHGTAIDKLHWLQKLAEQIGKDIHEVAADLRPTAVDDLGVSEALKALCNDWSARFLIKLDLQTLGRQQRLAANIEIAIYRIVQEALTNVLKHANASSVSIVLDQRSDEYRLIIEDDGIGMPRTAPIAEGSGLGLLGIRERLALLGGTITIESSVGAGTTLFVVIPLVARMSPYEEDTRHIIR